MSEDSPDLDSPSISPDQPTVLKELDRLYKIGSQVVGDDKNIIIDGTLVEVYPPNYYNNPELNDGLTGFTHSVIPGCEMTFIIEKHGVVAPIDPEATKLDDDSQQHLKIPNVDKIELLSDGSYRITTNDNFVYILTGTHTRNNELVDDSGNPILEAREATAKQVTDSLDKKKDEK